LFWLWSNYYSDQGHLYFEKKGLQNWPKLCLFTNKFSFFVQKFHLQLFCAYSFLSSIFDERELAIAARKRVVKLTPAVNFINVFVFVWNFGTKITKQNVTREKAFKKTYVRKIVDEIDTSCEEFFSAKMFWAAFLYLQFVLAKFFL